MTCDYQLGDLHFDSYNELYAYVLKHYNTLTQSIQGYNANLADLIYSLGKPETVAIINGIKSSVSPTMSVEFNVVSGEVNESYGASHMALSDYIDSAKDNAGKYFITPFTEEDYRLIIIKQLMDSGKTKEQAETESDKLILFDRDMGMHAANLHRQMRGYFSGVNTESKFIDTYKGDFSIPVLQQIFKGFEDLEHYIKRTHGENCEIIPSVTVTADIEDARKPVAHTIDLVVVDQSGLAHIYMAAGSSKDFDILPDVRMNKKDYLLGFARHILASKGISARGISLNIVPFELVGGDTITEAIPGEVSDRKAAVMGREVNPLMWGLGSFYRNIDEKITVDLPKTTIPDVVKKSKEHMKAFFPGKNLKQSAQEVDIDMFIKSRIVDSDNYSKGRFMIKDWKNPGHNIYIKTSVNNKYESAEVYEVAEKQVIASYAKSKTITQEFIDGFKKALNGSIALEELAPKSRPTLRTQIKVNFALYVNSNWEVVEGREDLLALGIIAFKNKNTKQIDLVAIRSGNLNLPIRMQKGTTILGGFLKDEFAIGTKNLMKFTLGNATLMQVMDAINMDPASFDNFKIGTIKVYSAETGESTIASTSELITSYTRLLKETNMENNLGQVEIASDLEVFKNYLLAALNKDLFDYSTSRTIFAELEGVNPEMRHEVLKILNKIRQLMETKYFDIFRQDVNDIISDYDNPIVNVYIQLCKTILYYEGVSFTQSLELTKFSGRYDGNSFLNGTEVSNPSTVPDDNLKRIVSLVRTGMHNMTQEIMDKWEPFRNLDIEQLWKGAGYSAALNAIFGNQNHIYENMFVQNPDGTKNSMLILKNPWTDTSLKPHESEFLKKWLTKMNELRFPTKKALDDAKADGTWLQIPLVEAMTATKMQNIKNPVAYAQREATGIMTYLRNAFKREEDDVYNEDEAAEKLDLGTLYKVMNRLEGSFNQERRALLLQDHPTEFWETNLDLLYALYLYATTRKKHMDRILPAIKALRLVGLMYGKQTATDMHNFDEFLRKYMTSHIHNQSILNKEEKEVIGTVAPLKFIASTLTMGFNVNTGIRNLLESVWKVPARIQTKFFAKEDCFTMTEWGKAMGIMIGDVPNFAQHVTLIEALNQRFRMQDMDANRLAEKITSYKSGLTHTTDRLLFWFSVAPDYFNRMSMLIAQMLHDGCYEACSFDENGFKYDWRKDKRFEVYASGQTTHPYYNKQRANYLFLIRTYNEENNTSLQEGDDVPLPYTTKQVLALKDFSDSVFGFYDHDQRALVERNAITSLFTQFKTYLTAARTMWFLAPGSYNKGETEQMIDEQTGKPMFLKIIKDAEGNEMMIPTIEDTGIPWIQERDSYMEGIYYTLLHMYLDVKEFGWKTMWQNTKNSKVRKNNLWLLAWHLIIAMIMAGLAKAGLEAYKSGRKEEKKYSLPTYTSVIKDQVVINGLSDLIGCFDDANIFTSLGAVTTEAEPASLRILTTLFTSTGEFFFGDKSFESYATKNFGMYRSTKILIDGLYDIANPLY